MDVSSVIETRINVALGGAVEVEEVAFLRRLRFKGKRPNALFFYRALQTHRDPAHFHPE